MVGTAVGLNLLFGFPILPSVLVLAFDGIILRVILPVVVRPSSEVSHYCHHWGSVFEFVCYCPF